MLMKVVISTVLWVGCTLHKVCGHKNYFVQDPKLWLIELEGQKINQRYQHLKLTWCLSFILKESLLEKVYVCCHKGKFVRERERNWMSSVLLVRNNNEHILLIEWWPHWHGNYGKDCYISTSYGQYVSRATSLVETKFRKVTKNLAQVLYL